MEESGAPPVTSKSEPKVQQRNPLDPNRNPTDVIYLRIVAVLIVGWFILNCINIFKGIRNIGAKTDHPITSNFMDKAVVALPELFLEKGAGLIIWIVTAGTALFLLFLKSLNRLARCWSIIAIIFLTLGIFMFSTKAVMVDESEIMGLYAAHSSFHSLIQLLFIIAALYATYTVTIDRTADVIRKSSEAIFFFPSFALFGLVILLVDVAIIAFTAVSLSSINEEDVGSLLICFLGGVYLLVIIYHFAAVVISQSISTWYWSQNREELSGGIILKSIDIVGRNHIGSVVFCSTMILPAVLSLYVLCKNKFQAPPNSSFLSFMVKFYLLFNAPEFALIAIGTHGVDVHEATKMVYRVFTRSCALVLSFIFIYSTIVVTFIVLAMLISLGIAEVVFNYDSFFDESGISSGFIIYGLGMYLFAAILVVAVITGETVLFHTTEEVEEDNEDCEITQIRSDVEAPPSYNQIDEVHNSVALE